MGIVAMDLEKLFLAAVLLGAYFLVEIWRRPESASGEPESSAGPTTTGEPAVAPA